MPALHVVIGCPMLRSSGEKRPDEYVNVCSLPVQDSKDGLMLMLCCCLAGEQQRHKQRGAGDRTVCCHNARPPDPVQQPRQRADPQQQHYGAAARRALHHKRSHCHSFQQPIPQHHVQVGLISHALHVTGSDMQSNPWNSVTSVAMSFTFMLWGHVIKRMWSMDTIVMLDAVHA